MNVVPLAQMAQIMDQRIKSVAYVVVLSEPTSIRPSKEMGLHKAKKKMLTSVIIKPMTVRLITVFLLSYETRWDQRAVGLIPVEVTDLL